jgi:hypothetical protein
MDHSKGGELVTETKTASFVDKSTWARGPWDEEPDRVEWRVPEFPGLACLAVRGPMGSWCGYVGVPPGHPAHGVPVQEIDGTVDVHGGITYAAPCQVESGRGAEALICHVPQPGESDDVWWLGFDCGHAWDVSPELDARLRLQGSKALSEAMAELDEQYEHRGRTTYKPIAFVRAEVESLARQLAAIGPGALTEGGAP